MSYTFTNLTANMLLIGGVSFSPNEEKTLPDSRVAKMKSSARERINDMASAGELKVVFTPEASLIPDAIPSTPVESSPFGQQLLVAKDSAEMLALLNVGEAYVAIPANMEAYHVGGTSSKVLIKDNYDNRSVLDAITNELYAFDGEVSEDMAITAGIFDYGAGVTTAFYQNGSNLNELWVLKNKTFTKIDLPGVIQVTDVHVVDDKLYFRGEIEVEEVNQYLWFVLDDTTLTQYDGAAPLNVDAALAVGTSKLLILGLNADYESVWWLLENGVWSEVGTQPLYELTYGFAASSTAVLAANDDDVDHIWSLFYQGGWQDVGIGPAVTFATWLDATHAIAFGQDNLWYLFEIGEGWDLIPDSPEWESGSYVSAACGNEFLIETDSGWLRYTIADGWNPVADGPETIGDVHVLPQALLIATPSYTAWYSYTTANGWQVEEDGPSGTFSSSDTTVAGVIAREAAGGAGYVGDAFYLWTPSTGWLTRTSTLPKVNFKLGDLLYQLLNPAHVPA